MRIIYAPFSKLGLPLAKVLATFIFTSLLYSLAGIIGYLLFKINFGGEEVLFVLVLLLAMNFLFSCLGVLISCLVKSEGVANQIISLVVTLLALLSGCFFPLTSLGETLITLSYYSPLTQFLRTLFMLIYDQNMTSFPLTLGVLLLFSGITVGLIAKLYHQEDFL